MPSESRDGSTKGNGGTYQAFDTEHSPKEGKGRVLFMSPHAFLLLDSDDPRVPHLREQVTQDRDDADLSFHSRMEEFPVANESKSDGYSNIRPPGGLWLQRALGVCSFMVLASAVTKIVVLLSSGFVEVDVERRCVAWDRSLLWFTLYFYALDGLSAAVVIATVLISLAILKVEFRDNWRRLVWLHNIHLFFSLPQLMVVMAVASVAYFVDRGYVGAGYLLLAIACVSSLDLGMAFCRSSLSVRFFWSGLLLTFADAYVYRRLVDVTECSQVGSGTAEQLDSTVLAGLVATAILAGRITMAAAALKRIARPTVPFGKRPTRPFATDCDSPLEDDAAFNIRYGRHSLVVRREGTEEDAHAAEDASFTRGYRIEGRRPRRLAWALISTMTLTFLALLALIVVDVVVMQITADVGRRCFAIKDSGRAVVAFFASEAKSIALSCSWLLVFAAALSMSARVQGSWSAALKATVQYMMFFWRGRPGFVLVVLFYIASESLSPTENPLSSTVAGSLLLIPILDAQSHVLSPMEGRPLRKLSAALCLSLLTTYVVSAIVLPNECSFLEESLADGRMSAFEHAALSANLTFYAVWCLQVLSIVSPKLRDARHPFLHFFLTPGTEFENAWVDDIVRGRRRRRRRRKSRRGPAEREKVREHHARSIELNQRPVQTPAGPLEVPVEATQV